MHIYISCSTVLLSSLFCDPDFGIPGVPEVNQDPGKCDPGNRFSICTSAPNAKPQ